MSVHIMPVCQCTYLYVSAHNVCMSVHIMPVCEGEWGGKRFGGGGGAGGGY